MKWIKMLAWASLSWAVILGVPARANPKVLACEPEWGALLQELGGDGLSISVATNAFQDPHQVQAKPSLLAKARNADMVVCTGAELEIGWLPLLLQQSGNPRIQVGQPGHFEAADFVSKLEVPNVLDRAQGDVHAAGNPHIQTDPRHIAQVAQALSARLGQIDPAHASEYAARHADFAKRWSAALARWEHMAQPLRGALVVSSHKSYVYLFAWLGMKEVATLEPKPGVGPTASHLQQVLAQMKTQPARMTLYSAYQDPKPAQWLMQNAGIAAVKVPFTVGGSEQAKDLFGLYEDTLNRLLSVGSAP
jgi:zinc/manganese transport system substrate-binding protein